MAGGSRARRADAQRNRNKLLLAAREVLAERGFGAEIQEIVSRAGIGSGALYRNFGSKEGLILEVTRELVNKTTLEVLAVAAHVPDAREAVRQTMEIGFRQVEQYGLLAVQLVAGTAPPPYSDELNPEALANIFRVLIRRGIEQGCFRRDLDVEFATAVWFAVVAPSTFRRLGARKAGDIAKLVGDFFLAGISSEQPETLRGHE